MYQDLEAVDPDYFKSLKFVLDNDIDALGIGLTFTADTDYFGRNETVELKSGGREIPVTDDNKLEYVNLVTMHRMTTAIREQLNAFQSGFWDMTPLGLLSIFNDNELELLIAGLPDINVDDLQANTEYAGYTAASPQVVWFWEAVRSFDREALARLL